MKLKKVIILNLEVIIKLLWNKDYNVSYKNIFLLIELIILNFLRFFLIKLYFSLYLKLNKIKIIFQFKFFLSNIYSI
jgi:hypothetical protein